MEFSYWLSDKTLFKKIVEVKDSQGTLIATIDKTAYIRPKSELSSWQGGATTQVNQL
jgi:hypothetical protein